MKRKKNFVHISLCAIVCAFAQQVFAQDGVIPVKQSSISLCMQKQKLGLLQMCTPEGEQNFEKAYSAFMESANMGYAPSMYYAGYMLYKGLGCKQSYEQAFNLFENGYSKGNMPCGYMLAICYRNGYGVDIDENKAIQILTDISSKGYKPATEELNREKAEVISEYRHETLEHKDLLFVNNNIRHCLSGLLLKLDYSGEKIVGAIPLEIDILNNNGKIEGIWTQDKNRYYFTGIHNADGNIVVDDLTVNANDRYYDGINMQYSVEKIRFSSTNDGQMVADVKMYSISEEEPCRPMVFIGKLNSTNVTGIANTHNNSKAINCNVLPTGQIEINYESTHNVNNINIKIFTTGGVQEQELVIMDRSKGTNSLYITPNVNKGLHIIKVIAGMLSYESIIIL